VTVAIEHTDEALFDELDSLGKARSVAKLSCSSLGILGPMTRVRVIRGIRQFRHGDAGKPVEPDGWNEW